MSHNAAPDVGTCSGGSNQNGEIKAFSRVVNPAIGINKCTLAVQTHLIPFNPISIYNLYVLHPHGWDDQELLTSRYCTFMSKRLSCLSTRSRIFMFMYVYIYIYLYLFKKIYICTYIYIYTCHRRMRTVNSWVTRRSKHCAALIWNCWHKLPPTFGEAGAVQCGCDKNFIKVWRSATMFDAWRNGSIRMATFLRLQKNQMAWKNIWSICLFICGFISSVRPVSKSRSRQHQQSLWSIKHLQWTYKKLRTRIHVWMIS